MLRPRIRARDVALALRPPEAISVRKVLHGRVREISGEPGPYAEVNVDVSGAVIAARLTRRACDALAPGCEVFALVKTIALDRAAPRDGAPAGPAG